MCPASQATASRNIDYHIYPTLFPRAQGTIDLLALQLCGNDPSSQSLEFAVDLKPGSIAHTDNGVRVQTLTDLNGGSLSTPQRNYAPLE